MRRIRRIVGIALVAVAAGSAASSAGSAPANVIFGTNGHDTIVATPAADVIYAKSGNDRITGVGDGDVVWASSGNDTIVTLPFVVVSGLAIHGNVGHDKIESGTGFVHDSFVNAGSGNDTVKITGCNNDVRGESGNDVYENLGFCPAPALNATNLGNGHDRVFLLYASNVLLGNGNDRLDTIFPGFVHTGSGNDRVKIQLGGDATVHLGTGHDELGIENGGGVTVFGSNGNDRVSISHAGDNVIHGQSGNDTITIDELGVNNDLDGGSGRDKARLFVGSSGTTCQRIERVVDQFGNPRACS